MSNLKIGSLDKKAAIKLLEFCEYDLSRFAKMVALDVGKESFLYRNATMLASQVSDLIEHIEKFEGGRRCDRCIEVCMVIPALYLPICDLQGQWRLNTCSACCS